jgi:hypothetical protein
MQKHPGLSSPLVLFPDTLEKNAAALAKTYAGSTMLNQKGLTVVGRTAKVAAIHRSTGYM